MDFSEQILSFNNNTLEYTSSYDSVGNLFFNDKSEEFSKTFIVLNNKVINYNNEKISKFLNLDFEEF